MMPDRRLCISSMGENCGQALNLPELLSKHTRYQLSTHEMKRIPSSRLSKGWFWDGFEMRRAFFALALFPTMFYLAADARPSVEELRADETLGLRPSPAEGIATNETT